MIDSWKSFNTSHVTLYLFGDIDCGDGALFQYISCYSLSGNANWNIVSGFSVSIHLMLLFIHMEEKELTLQDSFNTSHVTLYRERLVPD